METSQKEVDPTGRSANEAGSKLDHGKEMMGLVFHGFPRALLAVGEVATFGAKKYTPNGWREVPEGIRRYTDALGRHILKEGYENLDPDSGLLHAAHSAWNTLARLELILQEEENAKEDSNPTSEVCEGSISGREGVEAGREDRRAVVGSYVSDVEIPVDETEPEREESPSVGYAEFSGSSICTPCSGCYCAPCRCHELGFI